jgi:uncharacterized protein with NAD-binding domain and iron-sulfur cluster
VSDADTDHALRRVAILGGGMAAMAAAWRLSAPEHRDRIASVTVYQRGWRLGGKGASGRGPNGRIEEHGLHVWLGYYDNAFRIMRECYGELDRQTTDPGCPIRTWREAFSPAPTIGLGARDDDGWHHWTATFSANDQLPGEPVDRAAPMSPTEFVTRALRLLADFVRSLAQPAAEPSTSGRRGTVLSASPVLTAQRSPAAPLATSWAHASDLLAAGALEALLVAEATLRGGPAASLDTSPLTNVVSAMGEWREQLRDSVVDRPARRRAFELVDLVITCLRGVAADGLLVDPRGFRAIDGEEFRDWLSRHGAAPETFESPLVTGVYDLAFAYHRGDPAQPMFSAGTGLYMSALMYFGYRGSIFWKMQAGMGDIVFGPLYQTLVERGVRFEFYSRVDELRPDETGERLATVVIGRQRDPATRPTDPLIRVKGLPCFPVASCPDDVELERTHGRRADVGVTELRIGHDVDDVVFALPIGMVDEVCGALVASDRRWRDMARQISTVATQAAQLWLREDESDLGLVAPGVTLTGHVKPFDTMSSMTHLLPVEDWPDDDAPRSLWYLCSTMREEDEAQGADSVRSALLRHLDHHLADAAPGVTGSDGFRWELLAGSSDAAGPDRIDGQFVVANTDPSERYTQSLPGSGRYRLRPDESGFEGLVLAGDWTDCGLNVGCIEAAAVSGLQAANAVLGHDRWDGISGQWEPLDRR